LCLDFIRVVIIDFHFAKEAEYSALPSGNLFGKDKYKSLNSEICGRVIHEKRGETK
jgi:hypothetical protein